MEFKISCTHFKKCVLQLVHESCYCIIDCKLCGQAILKKKTLHKFFYNIVWKRIINRIRLINTLPCTGQKIIEIQARVFLKTLICIKQGVKLLSY